MESRARVWFKVPDSVRIKPYRQTAADNVSAKDIVLNLLRIFGANSLLGYSVEIYGEVSENSDTR